MNNKYIWFLLITIILLISNTKQLNLNDFNFIDLIYDDIYSNEENSSDISIILNPLITILNDTLYDIINNNRNNSNISDKCSQIFNETFFSSNYTLSKSFLKKFLEYTSIDTNDVYNYKECINRKYDKNKFNTSYIVIKFYKRKENNYSAQMNFYFPDNGIRGFCLPSGCNNEEYINIITELFKKRKEIMPIRYEFSEYSKKSFIISKQEAKTNNFDFIFSIILFTVTVIQIFFCSFPIMAFHFCLFFLKCFCCCLKKNINKKKFIGFRKCYSMSNNYKKLNEENFKDECLGFFKGIRGLNMFLYPIGMVFLIILHSPSKMDCSLLIKIVYENPFYSIIFYSIKYSPMFLLACSGAILGYKFLNYLDEKIKTQNFDNNEKIINNISFDTSNLIPRNIKEEEDFQLMNKGLLFRFIFYQLDRYIIFIIILLFTKYTLYFFGGSMPTWRYFKTFLIDNISFFEIIKNSLLFCINIIHSNDDTYDPISTIIFDYNWLAFNEIFLFLIGIFIIYFCARKKYQILYAIYLCIAISVAFKLLCYLIKINEYKDNQSYAPYILTYSYFGKIIINPFSNLGIYLIGTYYGILLYTYQKEITVKKANSQGKLFINRICFKLIRMIKSTKKNGPFIISILSLFIVLIFCIGQLFLNIGNNDSFKIFLKIIHFLFLFDNEIIIFFTFRSIFYLIIVMNFELLSFLRSKIWRIFNKIYFSYITISIPVILFFVYHSNTKILFNYTNIIYYSTVIIVFTFILGLLNYLVYEMPLKNIIRSIYIKRDKKNIVNRINDIDDNNSKSLLRE